MEKRPRENPSLAALALFSLLILSLAGCAKTHPNVIFITSDTTRPDHLSPYGYPGMTTPNLDEFSKDSLLFSNAFTVIPFTTPSHISIFTSLYPVNHGVTVNLGSSPVKIKKLAEILKDSGYSTAAFISALVVGRATGLDSGFDLFDGSFAGVNRHDLERSAADTMHEALSWLERRKDQKPFFLWVHFYDAHFPYDPPAPFAPSDASGRARWAELEPYLESHDFIARLDEKDREIIRSQYDGELTYIDDQIGRLLRYLKKNGLYKGSVIVFMSDHGEVLGENEDYYGHNCYLYDGSLKIPLLVKLPGFEHRTVGSMTTSLDVMPTLLDYLKIKDVDGGRRDGKDILLRLRGKPSGEPGPIFISTFYPKIRTAVNHDSLTDLAVHSMQPDSYRLGIRTERWKYWKTSEPGEGSARLFDLVHDPAEKTDVAENFKDVTADFERRLVFFKHPSIQSDDNKSETEAERMEKVKQLKSLGYL